jgi:hypothetical protein
VLPLDHFEGRAQILEYGHDAILAERPGHQGRRWGVSVVSIASGPICESA